MDSYDYVIAGGGTAGCVLANRLTEDGKATVLLLEAGPMDDPLEVRVPAAFPKLFKTERDWALYTQPQPSLNNRELFWPRGRMLGGCSSMNAMIYIRGHATDYDAWAAAGCEGWTFRDLLPYFKKSEDWHGPASLLHGMGGPLTIQALKRPNILSATFVKACEACGIPRNPDFNGAEQDGAGFYHVNQRNGRRWSAADAFLRPAIKRPNLTVLTRCHATRVLFERRRATGLEFIQQGRLTRVNARREVLLCGGAIHSPQMLMLSGVGPAQHLRDFDIPLVLDLPGVGKNLQDHLMGMVSFTCRQPVSLDAADTRFNALRYLLTRTGPFTSNIGEAGAFLRSSNRVKKPDIQLIFGPAYYLEHGFLRPQGHGYSIGFILLRPESRGSIYLKSRDPLEAPGIDANYLEDDADLHVMRAAFHQSRAIGASKTFAPFRVGEYLPGPDATSSAVIDEHLRERSETVYHPVGSCRMGAGPGAVVDSRLLVRGIDALRVVDASIMPTIPGGNTHAPVIMIAEKAADMIRAAARA